jgi:hypothetical protein
MTSHPESFAYQEHRLKLEFSGRHRCRHLVKRGYTPKSKPPYDAIQASIRCMEYAHYFRLIELIPHCVPCVAGERDSFSTLSAGGIKSVGVAFALLTGTPRSPPVEPPLVNGLHRLLRRDLQFSGALSIGDPLRACVY